MFEISAKLLFSGTFDLATWNRLSEDRNITSITVIYKYKTAQNSPQRDHSHFSSTCSEDRSTVENLLSEALMFVDFYAFGSHHHLVFAIWASKLQ